MSYTHDIYARFVCLWLLLIRWDSVDLIVLTSRKFVRVCYLFVPSWPCLLLTLMILNLFIQIFNHLRLCLTTPIHNLKCAWLKITHYFLNLRPNIYKSAYLNIHFIPNNSDSIGWLNRLKTNIVVISRQSVKTFMWTLRLLTDQWFHHRG